ncbi:MAG: YybH family protein [Thermoguttaceae bacterium]
MHRTFFNPATRSAGLCLAPFVLAASLFRVCSAADAEKPGATADESAIRATIDSYVAAYNRGDAKAVAAHWSDSGEWTSPSGQRFQGRQAIEKEMHSLFNENKGVRIEVINPSIRMVSPQVAIEEGTVRVIRPSEPPSESTYLAVDVKEGGRWKLNTVRETDVPETPAASSQLQELAWLVGDWVDDSPEVDDAATVTWAKNKTYLTYAFKISEPGSNDALEGTQVIGWDPAADTIRSWMFDSDGGFGEGTWTKKENSWVVKFSQVLPDGRKASATNVYTLVDGNTFTWKSIGRKVDGQFMPNIDEVKMVRKTVDDAVQETGKAAIKTLERAAK